MTAPTDNPQVLDAADFDSLLGALQSGGYTVIGPVARDSAIHYDEISSSGDLPCGWSDEYGPGHYRLQASEEPDLFGYVLGAQSWKRWLHPPRLKLFSATRENGGFSTDNETEDAQRYAFIGVRPCELQAIGIQDRVFLGQFRDPHYEARRRDALIVVVNCGRAGATCFCTSMESGPRARQNFDIALTEIIDGTKHYFLAETGSERGAEICRELPTRPANKIDLQAADNAEQRAIEQMQKHLDTEDLPAILQRNVEHPRWDDVAERCLACGNCTMVCPTCFCTAVEDVSDLSANTAERWRTWDSCFSSRFSYIHGGNVRESVRSRYRQWLTHKLSTWHDQFDQSGCVGCGRCVSWCPVGIDLTEEAAAIRATDCGAET